MYRVERKFQKEKKATIFPFLKLVKHFSAKVDRLRLFTCNN